MPSDKQRYVAGLFDTIGENLADYVTARRAAGESWDDIAHHIHTKVGERVNGWTVNRWFPDLE